jgi:glutathione peroxidase-family protein
MTNTQTQLKSIYDIDLNSADGTPNFLQQFKGKAAIIVNTTVGCGNANQLEVLQWLQDEFGGDDFQIIGIPTNDYCGPGVTHGKWSQGITCGSDSKNYGEDVYGTTFQYSEMVHSIPNDSMGEDLGVPPGHNGLGQPYGEPHDMYKEIRNQIHEINAVTNALEGEPTGDEYYSWWLNLKGGGGSMGGNYEKYLIDKDGYVIKHFQCTVLNYDSEKTVKEAAKESGERIGIGMGRSPKIFAEEYGVIKDYIKRAMAGEKSIINPNK